jgi:hypothetical protein
LVSTLEDPILPPRCLRGGRPVIIPSAEGISLGGKAFPSYVAITADGQMLIGEPAKRQAAANPEPVEKAGGPETLHLSRPRACAPCKGSGAKPGTTPKRCENCKGTGQHVERESKENVLLQRITTCTVCGGRGSIIEQLCPECHGTGETTEDQTLTVQVPVGVEEGMALRIPGHGLPGRIAVKQQATSSSSSARGRMSGFIGEALTSGTAKPSK